MKTDIIIVGNPLVTALIHISEIFYIPATIDGRNFVYILKQDKKIIYIGRTRRLRKRLSTWMHSIKFNKIYLLEYPSHIENRIAERVYIKQYRPPYNHR